MTISYHSLAPNQCHTSWRPTANSTTNDIYPKRVYFPASRMSPIEFFFVIKKLPTLEGSPPGNKRQLSDFPKNTCSLIYRYHSLTIPYFSLSCMLRSPEIMKFCDSCRMSPVFTVQLRRASLKILYIKGYVGIGCWCAPIILYILLYNQSLGGAHHEKI